MTGDVGLGYGCDGRGRWSTPSAYAGRGRTGGGSAGGGSAGGGFLGAPIFTAPILFRCAAGCSCRRQLRPLRQRPLRREWGARRGAGAAPPVRRHPQLQICNTESHDGGRWGTGTKLVWPPTALYGYGCCDGLGRVAGDYGGRLLFKRSAIRRPITWEGCRGRKSSRMGQRGLGTC